MSFLNLLLSHYSSEKLDEIRSCDQGFEQICFEYIDVNSNNSELV